MADSAAAAPADCYVVANEPGAEHPALPTWANRRPDPAALGAGMAAIERHEIAAVPGAFQLTNVLSAAECTRFIELSEAMGYLPDAAVSLPRSVRHNHNVTWVTDDATAAALWQRCKAALNTDLAPFGGRAAVGLNQRFRFYRYQPGDYFAPHTDGAWPGSRVINDELITDAFGDRYSQLSFIIFLSDGYRGGATQFYLNREDPTRPARSGQAATVINVRTALGAVLCFPHGLHPQHCLHSSEPIASGTKYIIRTDVLFLN